jgi:hypothetical protein
MGVFGFALLNAFEVPVQYFLPIRKGMLCPLEAVNCGHKKAGITKVMPA